MNLAGGLEIFFFLPVDGNLRFGKFARASDDCPGPDVFVSAEVSCVLWPRLRSREAVLLLPRIAPLDAAPQGSRHHDELSKIEHRAAVRRSLAKCPSQIRRMGTRETRPFGV